MNRWIQFSGLFRREISRFLKVPLQTIGAPIINTFLYLVIFGVSLGHSIHLKANLSYLAFLIPGLIAMSIIKNAFDNGTSSIIGQKYVNELQDHRISPLTPQLLCCARGLASLVRGLLVGFITYLIGELFFLVFQGKWLAVYNPHIFIYFAIVGGWTFGNLGTAIGMSFKSFEHVGAISALVLLPLIYLGGVFFSLENIDPFWQKISYINPLYYMINGIRYGVIGKSDVDLIFATAVSFAFFTFSYILALISLKKGSNYMR